MIVNKQFLSSIESINIRNDHEVNEEEEVSSKVRSCSISNVKFIYYVFFQYRAVFRFMKSSSISRLDAAAVVVVVVQYTIQNKS